LTSKLPSIIYINITSWNIMRYPQGRGMVLLKLQPVTTNTNDDRGTKGARGTARMAWELLDMAGSWLVCQWICYQRLGFNSEKNGIRIFNISIFS
jgi:hypothetical protein